MTPFQLMTTDIYTLLLLIAILIHVASCDDCDEGTTKCEGDNLYVCLSPPTDVCIPFGCGGTAWHKTRCRDEGGTCATVLKDNWESIEMCVLSTERCPDDTRSLCFEDTIGSCLHTDLPVCEEGCQCSSYQHCVTNGTEAICVYKEGSCSNGQRECFPEKATSWIGCYQGIWNIMGDCSDGGTCVDIGDGGVGCASKR